MRGEEEMEKQKERCYGEIGPLFTNMVYFLSSLINIWPVLFSRLDNRQTPFIEATRKQTETNIKTSYWCNDDALLCNYTQTAWFMLKYLYVVI